MSWIAIVLYRRVAGSIPVNPYLVSPHGLLTNGITILRYQIYSIIGAIIHREVAALFYYPL